MERHDIDGPDELDDMDGEPGPWSRAVGIACLIAAGMIVVYLAVNS